MRNSNNEDSLSGSSHYAGFTISLCTGTPNFWKLPDEIVFSGRSVACTTVVIRSGKFLLSSSCTFWLP